jgi:hypothetical protein
LLRVRIDISNTGDNTRGNAPEPTIPVDLYQPDITRTEAKAARGDESILAGNLKRGDPSGFPAFNRLISIERVPRILPKNEANNATFRLFL